MTHPPKPDSALGSGLNLSSPNMSAEQKSERESLKDEMGNALGEARMVLPGIQALFGFQTIAVFSERFDDLSDHAKLCHLMALVSVVVAIALIMTPAAYHRVADPARTSQATVRLSSLLISAALLPLAVGMALDMFVVSLVISDRPGVSAAIGAGTLVLLLSMWLVFPFLARARKNRDQLAGPLPH
jgi:hypothetical protein